VPASTEPAATEQAREATDGADVIRAHFGGAKAAGAATKGAAAARKDTPAPATRTGGSRAAGPAKGATPPGSAKAAVHDDAHDDGHPVPAKAFSGRMLALAVVMIAITIMLAPTVKVFFDKRAEIAALNADIAASQAEQNTLRQQVSRWQDPNYVKQQARDRINMVMPGETGYWVFGSDLPAGSSSSQSGAAAQDPADLPWVDSLWESIRRAATD
jgi:cell division protein FtsB